MEAARIIKMTFKEIIEAISEKRREYCINDSFDWNIVVIKVGEKEIMYPCSIVIDDKNIIPNATDKTFTILVN